MDHRDVLLKAASLVEQGWCQWQMASIGKTPVNLTADNLDRIDHVCAIGALRRAAFDLSGEERALNDWTELLDEAISALERAVFGSNPSQPPSERGTLIPAWNDSVGRTAEQVAEKMRVAALA